MSWLDWGNTDAECSHWGGSDLQCVVGSSHMHPHKDQSAMGKIKDSFCFQWIQVRGFMKGLLHTNLCWSISKEEVRGGEKSNSDCMIGSPSEHSCLRKVQETSRMWIAKIYLFLMWTYFPFSLCMCGGLNIHACGGRHGSAHVEDSRQPWVSDFTFQITWDGTPAGFLQSTTYDLTCYILGIPLSLPPISLKRPWEAAFV